MQSLLANVSGGLYLGSNRWGDNPWAPARLKQLVIPTIYRSQSQTSHCSLVAAFVQAPEMSGAHRKSASGVGVRRRGLRESGGDVCLWCVGERESGGDSWRQTKSETQRQEKT